MSIEFDWSRVDDDKLDTHRCVADRYGASVWYLFVRRISEARTASWEYVARRHHSVDPYDEWTGKYYRTKGDAAAAVERVVRDHVTITQ